MLISIAIQFAINDNDRYAGMLEGMELAADLITQSKIIENLYMARVSMQSAPGQQLEEALLRLYVKILEFTSDAARYFDKSKLAHAPKEKEKLSGSIFDDGPRRSVTGRPPPWCWGIRRARPRT